jgi:plasmid stability protein
VDVESGLRAAFLWVACVDKRMVVLLHNRAMSISKFALRVGAAALSVGVAPVSVAWAQGVGVPAGAAAVVPTGAGQGQAAVVYRCPGPPVLYTDTLSPQEARSKNCKPLTDLPVAVAPPVPPASNPGFATPPPGGSRVGTAVPAPTSSAQAASSGTPSAAAGVPAPPGSTGAANAVAMPDARVRPDDQRSRDAEARRILEAELRREEARLNEAIKASGTAKPGERVGADAAQIRRAESDIEAIRRELGRLR